MNQPCVFLSYVKADQTWAEQLTKLLAPLGVTVCDAQSAQQDPTAGLDQVRQAIQTASHTCVLLGPATRLSRWVDREIELSTEPREDGPGAGLIGVILPTHEDFSAPYYDPANVPIRLHDLIQGDYAVIRKWSENPEDLWRWLDEAERRRHSSRPEPSLRAAAEIYRFGWDQSVDEARPSPEAL